MQFLFKFGWVVKYWYSWTQTLSPKDKRTPIRSDYTSFNEIEQEFNKLRYQHDPELGGVKFDNIHHPQHTYWLALNRQGKNDLSSHTLNEETTGGDCDDSTSLWCAALFKNKDKLGIKEVWFGITHYKMKNGQTPSHAVCVFRDRENKVAHVGNWYGNSPQYVDSGMDIKAGLRYFAIQNEYEYLAGSLIKIDKLTKDDRLVFGKFLNVPLF